MFESEQFEGWEASEEAAEQAAEEAAANFNIADTFQFGEPGEDGTSADAQGFEGGTWITTPKGHRVVVGVLPEDLTDEVKEKMGTVADEMLEEMEEKIRQQMRDDPDTLQRIEWFNAVMGASKDFSTGKDRETLWKLVEILFDYEKAAKIAWEKGYIDPRWDVATLMGLLPPCEKVE